jgi:hypothetical protein
MKRRQVNHQDAKFTKDHQEASARDQAWVSAWEEEEARGEEGEVGRRRG